MDIKAYIESGIIEGYVLGLATAEEAAELEMLRNQHPEIRAAVDEFASSVERNALQNAVPPPSEVKEKLMSALATEFETASVFPISTFQSSTESYLKTDTTRIIRTWKYLAAASVILLIASAAFNFYFYNNYRTANDKYQALLIERNSLQANNDAYRTNLDNLEENFRLIGDTAIKIVKMPGVKGKESEFATVYWDTKTKDVYLLPNKLDQAPPDKQYQLWAIVNGQPVDAGLIGDCAGLCRMKNIPQAQAFAITLEKKGGSETPTLSNMFVMGGI